MAVFCQYEEELLADFVVNISYQRGDWGHTSYFHIGRCTLQTVTLVINCQMLGDVSQLKITKQMSFHLTRDYSR